MIFQILDANYTYEPGTQDRLPLVQLFGITEAGKSASIKVGGFRPYFYARVAGGMQDEVSEKLASMDLGVEILERFEPIGYQSKPSRMLEIIAKDPKSVRTLREQVRDLPGVEAVYETDILFKNRFLIDTGLGGMGWVNVDLPEWTSGKEPPMVSWKSLTALQRESNAPMRYMAFDIECRPHHGEMPNPGSDPVILISVAFKPQYKGLDNLVLVGKKIDCTRKDVESCADEKELLSRFGSVIREFDPDILAGYNSNEFDVPYMNERLEKLRVSLRPGRDGSSWYIKPVVNTTNVSITGRVVVDLLPIIRSSFSLKRYTLRNVAVELLKDMEKYDMDPKEIEDIWEDGGDRLAGFIKYARRDAVLALRLLLDLRLMDKYIALSHVSGSLLQDVVNGGQSGMVESLLLRKFRDRGRVVPPKPDSRESEDRYIESDELKGGAVLPPEKGLLENLVILDYKSLYPTIMMAHNLCYSTVLTHPEPWIKGAIKSPSGGEFVPPEVSPGIVPGVLRDLLERRSETKRQMKQAGDEERRFLDARQYAYKILLNSFYGYSGYARARLYSQPLANAVTSFGRENLIRTKNLIEGLECAYVLDGETYFESSAPPKVRENAKAHRYGLSVVYGDTDSVFVRISREDSGKAFLKEDELRADAELIGLRIAQTITSSLPDPMELVFEAFARRAIFLAKKRYALWVFEPAGQGWKDKIKVRGMETVRRDWCELTSKTLNRCLELVLKEGKVEEAVSHVRSVISRVQRLDLAEDPEMVEDLTLTRRYTKSTGSYKNKQPHIQLVEKIKGRGGVLPEIGDRVPFLIVSGCKTNAEFGVDNHQMGTKLFVDKAEDPQYAVKNNLCIDKVYYIDKQILPPVMRILSAFNVSENQLIKGSEQGSPLGVESSKLLKQKSLFDF